MLFLQNAQANVFVGNPASSMSAFIAQSRVALGKSYNHLFRARDATCQWTTVCGESCLFQEPLCGRSCTLRDFKSGSLYDPTVTSHCKKIFTGNGYKQGRQYVRKRR